MMNRTKALEAIRYLQYYSRDPKYIERFDNISSYVENSWQEYMDLREGYIDKCQQIAVLSDRIAKLEEENKRLKDMLKVAEDTMNLVL